MEENNHNVVEKGEESEQHSVLDSPDSFRSPCLERGKSFVEGTPARPEYSPFHRNTGICKTPAFLASLGINALESVNTWDSTMETPTTSSPSLLVPRVNADSCETGKIQPKSLFGKCESKEEPVVPLTERVITSTPNCNIQLDERTKGTDETPTKPSLSKFSFLAKRRLSQIFVYPKPVPLQVPQRNQPESRITDADVSPVLSQKRKLSQPITNKETSFNKNDQLEEDLRGKMIFEDSTALRTSTESQHLDGKIKVRENAEEKHLDSCGEPRSSELESGFGFATAAGKTIAVSRKALDAAKKIFDEELEKAEALDESGHSLIEMKINSPKKSIGFSTGHGKRISVCEKSLRAARKMFEENDESNEEEHLQPIILAAPEQSFGFSTARGKKISVCEKSLQAARRMFEEDTDNSKPKEQLEPKALQAAEPSFSFSTARGKKISVCEESLRAARGMFEEDTDSSKPEETVEQEALPVPDPSFSCGFATARGKEIPVSVKALQAARKIFQEEDEKVTQEELSKKSGESFPDKSYGGFSTAAGKTVKVSEKSLVIAKKLFDNIDTPEQEDEEGVPPEASVDAVFEFALKRRGADTVKTTQNSTEVSEKRETETGENPNIPWNWKISKNVKQVNEDSTVTPTRSSAFKNPLRDRKRSLDKETQKKEENSQKGKKIHRTDSDDDLFGEGQNSAEDRTGFTPVKINPEFFSSSPTLSRKKKKISISPMEIEDCSTQTQLLILNNDPTFVSREVLEARQQARDLQQLKIQQKIENGRHFVKPQPGILWTKRQQNKREKITLKKMFGNPGNCLNNDYLQSISSKILNIHPENAEFFIFYAWDYFDPEICKENGSGVLLGDFQVILSNDNTIGLDEIRASFMSQSSVDPSLVDCKWIANHYRWIVWKLAAMERSFPLENQCLTPLNVLEQLKYRYDREIDNCQRSALRRILEQDDSPAKTMALCVSRVDRTSTTPLELTDGWYAVRAQCDLAMETLIDRGKVFVGLKLIVSGAELMSSNPCHPLEAGADAVLKISTNSTRRARWDCRLGYFSRPQPFPVTLGSIFPDGGTVSCLRVTVARVYPLIYKEKSVEGSRTVFRSQRAFERKAVRDEQSFEMIREKAVSEAILEFEREEKMKNFDENNLTDEEKRKQLEEAVRKRLDDSMSTCQKNVPVPVLKVRLIDPDSPDSLSALVSIWRPSEDILSILKENKTYHMYGLVPYEAHRPGEIQLNSTNSTRYVETQNQGFDSLFVRRVTQLDEIQQRGFKPFFSELDVVGFVVSVSELTSKNSFQDTVITDGGNFLILRCWGGLEEHALEAIVTVGKFLCFSNLSWRSINYVSRIPYAYISELTAVSARPVQVHLTRALEKLIDEIGDPGEVLEKSLERLGNLLPAGTTPSSSTASPRTPLLLVEKRNNPQTPVTSGGNSVAKNRTRLLERYGAPPPVSPLVVTPSRNARMGFKPPFKKPA